MEKGDAVALKYVINLKEAHKRSGLSAYMVAKRIRQQHPGAKISTTTVSKYANAEVIQSQFDIVVALLCDFYAVDFHEIVKVIKSPDMQTPLTAAAV